MLNPPLVEVAKALFHFVDHVDLKYYNALLVVTNTMSSSSRSFRWYSSGWNLFQNIIIFSNEFRYIYICVCMYICMYLNHSYKDGAPHGHVGMGSNGEHWDSSDVTEVTGLPRIYHELTIWQAEPCGGAVAEVRCYRRRSYGAEFGPLFPASSWNFRPASGSWSHVAHPAVPHAKSPYDHGPPPFSWPTSCM